MKLASSLALGAAALALVAGCSGDPRPAAAPAPAHRTTSAAAPSTSPSASPSPTATPPTPSATPTTPTPTVEPVLMRTGDQGDAVRELQARLRQIAWFEQDVTGYYGPVTAAAVSGFQAKRGLPATGTVDQPTLDRLEAMTTEPTAAALANRPEPNVPGPLDARCRTGRVLCIDKTSRTLRWVVDGQVQRTTDVRFGAEYTPTREGVFHVYLKDVDHVSHLYGSSMPYAMFFSGGQAVHYSSDFAAVGYAGASHGCVNVRDEDAVAWLFDHVQVGDAVVVYRS